MSFLHPEFIYMMMPLLFILFGLLLTQSEAVEQLFSLRVLAKLRVDTNRLSAKVRNFFYFLMFVFIILALAGPVVEQGRAKVQGKNDPLYIALDISGSMRSEDLYPNRLEFAKQKVLMLLQRAGNSQVGLIAFAESSYLVAPPSRDHDLLRFLLKPLNSGSSSEEGTRLLNVLKAVNRLAGEGEGKRLLLISDGGDNADYKEEIAYAKGHDIRVYTLGVGTVQGAVVPDAGGTPLLDNGTPVVSRLNPRFASLAEASGGRALQADAITSLLLHKESALAEDDEKPIYVHLFILPIGLAMLMLVLATSSFSRGEKYYLPSLLIAGSLLFPPSALRAGLLDFTRLKKAGNAYENRAYGESAKAYNRYALEHQSLEATYNAANSYYRNGQFKNAAGLYRSIHFIEADKNHQLYHNLGNALVRLGDETSLKEAAAAYKKALTYREDNATAENLERVEAALKNLKSVRSSMPPPTATGPSSPAEKGDGERAETVSRHYRESVMSDREANKWFSMLDARQHGMLYKIEVTDPQQGGSDVKPW